MFSIGGWMLNVHYFDEKPSIEMLNQYKILVRSYHKNMVITIH